MSKRRNPFKYGKPIKTPKEFSGRKHAVEFIIDRTRGHQCTSIVGERRTGKTSVLFYLKHKLETFGLLENPVIVLYMDCGTFRDPVTFWQQLFVKLLQNPKSPVQIPQSTKENMANLLNKGIWDSFTIAGGVRRYLV